MNHQQMEKYHFYQHHYNILDIKKYHTYVFNMVCVDTLQVQSHTFPIHAMLK